MKATVRNYKTCSINKYQFYNYVRVTIRKPCLMSNFSAQWNSSSVSPALVSPSTDEEKVESIGDCSENFLDANIIHQNNNHIEEVLDEKVDFEVLTSNDVQQALKSRYKGSKGTKGNSSTSSRGNFTKQTLQNL